MKKYFLKIKAFNGITNKESKNTYMSAIKKFHKWELKIPAKNRVKYDAPKEQRVNYIQDYELFLEKENLTPATIHNYLAPICKAFYFNMRLIKKPRRTSERRVRSRDSEKNKLGKKQHEMEKYQRLINFQRVVGIRRAELKRLKGCDLVTDESGYLCVFVRRGKGGKKQKQRVLEPNIPIIKETFKGVGEDENLFSPDEMKNSIDLHGLRAENAYVSYEFYLDKILNEPGYREQLIEELSLRWLTDHPKENKNSKKYKEFMEALTNSKPYKIRAGNIKMAKEKNHPLVYNRLAVMAVSVFHLSHWRLGVTITNYFC